jgi:beta-alanine--pyruvate transaminase
MTGPANAIEFYHGYTYSGHPLASAAAIATLDLFQADGLFQRAVEMAPYWEEAVHALRGLPYVIDIRNIGLVAGIELQSIPGQPTARAVEAFKRCWERGVLVRTTGDTIAMSPPLIISRAQVDELVGTVADVLRTLP